MITDISILNDYFISIDFHTSLGFATIFVLSSLFISLQCCDHNEIATVATFGFLRAGGS